MRKRICVIDGRGGGLGSRLVAGLQTELGSDHHIMALGTNVVAAEAMRQAGASSMGIGARAIAEAVSTADVIVTSLNLILPGAMLGEVTPGIARAVLGARAKKVLLPVNRSRLEVVGAAGMTLDRLIVHSVHRVRAIVATPTPNR